MYIVMFVLLLFAMAIGVIIGFVLNDKDIPTMGKIVIFMPNKDMYLCMNDDPLDLDKHKQVMLDIVVEDSNKQEKHPL